MSGKEASIVLEGTTRKVFRFVYRQHGPVGIHDVQRGLGLSSPSVAHYHVVKLLKAGLIREEGEGYVVDKAVFEDMIRVRKTIIPLQSAYAIFFLTALVVLVTFMRPAQLSSMYVFALFVVVVAFAVSLLEAYKVTRTIY